MKPKIQDVLTRPVRPIKIVQFGEGNFLRGFVDDFIQQLNDSGLYEGHVCVIQPRPGGHVKELMQQQGFYTLILEGLHKGQSQQIIKPIQVIQQAINPYTQWDDFVALAKNPEVQVLISNTTEAGIVYSKQTDFTCPPLNFPAKVTAFLKYRWQHFHGDYTKGCWILPCELIEQNGDTLKEFVIQLAKDHHESEDFITWLSQANHFYNTLVDRIVVGYPHQQAPLLSEKLGYEDAFLVKGEIYHSWLIQGDSSLDEVFPLSKLDANIQYVNDLVSYRRRKVAILNGCHTCMVPLGWLSGYQSVQETICDSSIHHFLQQFLQLEVWPSLPFTTQQLQHYTSEIMKRFDNPNIQHDLQSISLNSFSKFNTRILPTLVHHYQTTHTLAYYGLFSLACLLVMGSLKNEEGLPRIKDESSILDTYLQWEENQNQTIVALLNLPLWKNSFKTMDGSINKVIDYVHKIESEGFQQVLIQEGL